MSKMSECGERALFADACAFAVLLVLGSSSAIASESVLYRFQGGSDGIGPYGALIADSADNLYGTTANGGSGTGCEGTNGCGTVFELKPNGSETVLYNFKGGTDGALPHGSLVVDASGNFYGTTGEGGASNVGTVFRLAPNGTEAVLYAFTGGSDGRSPAQSLAQDQNGNLYGATGQGGNTTSQCKPYGGCGTAFEVDQSGNESVLYAFGGGSDGLAPSGGPIRDGSGNLYGVTAAGGVSCEGISGCGTVYEVTPSGSESVLHAFVGGKDGWGPSGPLIMDAGGNLYGTTSGSGSKCGCGTVFKVTPGGTESVLYAFKGGHDGDLPESGVIQDSAGNLYGTTLAGGRGTGCNSEGTGCGTAFELKTDGTETTLFAFKSKNGYYPVAPLLLRRSRLYGTASEGGANNDGVVFSVTK